MRFFPALAKERVPSFRTHSLGRRYHLHAAQSAGSCLRGG